MVFNTEWLSDEMQERLKLILVKNGLLFARYQVIWMSSSMCVDSNSNILCLLPADVSRVVAEFV